MARKTARKQTPQTAAPAPAAPDAVNDGPGSAVTTARGRRFVRLFLMVAGGLAAPCLALAAFFLTNSGGSDTPARSAAVQPGRVTGTTAPGATTPSTTGARVTTTTTTAPATPTGPPPRDPFAPLVNQGPATPGR
jgi:hypothetical protein